MTQGKPIWGMPVKQGTTLYLCLEESTLRIQYRLFDVTEDVPETLHICTESAALGKGLEQQLEDFLQEHPDTVLIIMDTLQMIRIYYRDVGLIDRLPEGLREEIASKPKEHEAA